MPRKSTKAVEYEVSSGNVYADLGFADSAEMLAKARIVAQIGRIIQGHKLTQAEAGEEMNIDTRKLRAKKPTAAPARPANRAERYAAGKALRDRVPREQHGEWNPPKNRHDPVDLVIASSEGRVPGLIPIRYGRMSVSP